MNLFSKIKNNSDDNSSTIFTQSISDLSRIGKAWEDEGGNNASYYIVHSLLGNSASLLIGDIRYPESYTSLLTIKSISEKGVFLRTSHYDNFEDEYFHIEKEINDEIAQKCINSTYNKNIISNLFSILTNPEEKCKIKVRTGIFWSVAEINSSDCQKIFKSLNSENNSFTFNQDSSDDSTATSHINFLFLKQTNKLSINSIQFKTRIRKGTIQIEIDNEIETIKYLR